MKNFDFKKLLPHLIAVVVFLILSFGFNSSVLNDKKLVAHDDLMYQGAAKEIQDFREKNGEDPLWTSRMFSGMPAYLISYQTQNNITQYVFKIFSIFPTPVGQFFVAMLGFYIMLLTFGFKPYTSMVGAIAFAFCSYNAGIVQAGHNAKLWAIGIFPIIIAGINLVFQKKYLWGALLTGVAVSAEILVNHVQMTYYYFAFFVSFYLIYLVVNSIIKGEIKHGIVASVIVGFMILVGVLTNANRLIPTSEYTEYSTRGKSELVAKMNQAEKTEGLDRSYIVGYSSGKDDWKSFLVPNFKGAKNGLLLNNKDAMTSIGRSEANKIMQGEQAVERAGGYIDQYWGMADGYIPVYSGVIIFVLCMLGFFVVKHPIKWVVLPGIILTIMLSWGKNYMGFTDIFINHFPMYNKFRSVNSIIIVTTFAIPLLASFLLAQLIDKPESLDDKLVGNITRKKVLFGGLGFFVLLLGLMYLMPTTFQDYFKESIGVQKLSESEFISLSLNQQGIQDSSSIVDAIENARIAIFKSDVLRSLGILVLGALAIILYSMKKINWQIMIAIVGVVTLADVWTHSKRYLSDNDFKKVTEAKKEFLPSPADNFILADPTLHKRVCNLSTQSGPFNDASTSYFHQSIGGYHGAKVKRYQEIIENYIQKEFGMVFNTNRMDSIQLNFAKANVLNMLNTKYFIFDKNSSPLINSSAFGPAWLVGDIKQVENADAELEELGKNNLRSIAIVDKKFSSQIKNNFGIDSTGKITLAKMEANRLEYNSTTSIDQYAIFSEVYYPAGWKVLLDGNPVEYFRANYILRGIFLPKGNHKIEFYFEPESYQKGEMYSLIGSIILIITLIVALIFTFKNRNKEIQS